MSAPLIFFHLSMFGAYTYTAYHAFYEMKIPIIDNKFEKWNPGQFKYLTIWGVIAQALFFFLCVLNDVFGTNKVAPKKSVLFRRIKDYFHATFSFPLAMFVGITFWALMFVNRELVLPKALDPYFPWWLNHLMHTMIMISTTIEMIVAPRHYPKRSKGFGGLLSLMVIYLVWVHVIYYKSGEWVYPVMDVLSLPLRVVFFLVLFAFSASLYFVGETFDNLLWGNEKYKQLKNHSKSK